MKLIASIIGLLLVSCGKEEAKPAPQKKEDGVYDPEVDFHFKNLPK